MALVLRVLKSNGSFVCFELKGSMGGSCGGASKWSIEMTLTAMGLERERERERKGERECVSA